MTKPDQTEAETRIAELREVVNYYKRELGAALRERDEANKRASAALDRQAHWEVAAVDQQDQITTLRAALETMIGYARHDMGCSHAVPPHDTCDCGLSEALAADRSPRDHGQR